MTQVPGHELSSGAIIEGGVARRFGGLPKGLLTVDGESLLGRLARLLERHCAETFIVGDPDGPYGEMPLVVRPDILPDKGAPGGVHAALHYAAHEWVYILSCDLPFIRERTLKGLSPADEFDVVMYHDGTKDQPLIALWRRSALAVLTRQLSEKNPGFADILAELRVKRITPAVEQELTNINTRSEALEAGLDPESFRLLNRG